MENEKMSVVFNSIKNRAEMAQWIMRQWFDAGKHRDKPWFSPDVTEENVLARISASRTFPYSPLQLMDMWRAMPAIRSGLKMISVKELQDLEEFLEEETSKKVKYNKGEDTLTTIGKELGDITAPMIQRLERSGMEKIHSLSGGKNFTELESEDSEELNNRIDAARETAAVIYTNLLRESENMNVFFNSLIERQIMTPVDLKITTKREKDTLELLKSYSNETIVQFLMNDISRDMNVIKSYQSYVAHTVFPRRRGRPAKTEEDTIGI